MKNVNIVLINVVKKKQKIKSEKIKEEMQSVMLTRTKVIPKKSRL